MGLLAHLDREYNLVIDFDDLQKYNSLIKLFELVEEKIIDKPAITKIDILYPVNFSTSNVLSKNYKDASAIEKIINKTGIDQKYKSEKSICIGLSYIGHKNLINKHNFDLNKVDFVIFCNNTRLYFTNVILNYSKYSF